MSRPTTKPMPLRPGDRVYVMGTKHNGFRGEVLPRPEAWEGGATPVALDEWPGEVFRFYRHNLLLLST